MTPEKARAQLRTIAGKFLNDANASTDPEVAEKAAYNAGLLTCIADDCEDGDAVNVLEMLKRDFPEELPS